MGPVIEKNQGLPPLQSGDCLTAAEFERRLAAMGEDVRAELIDGVVYMPPPVGFAHGVPHASFIVWLGTYAAHTRGVKAAAEPTLRLDERNRPEPDACLWIEPGAGGRVRYDPDGILRGAVELVAEVARSSAAYDLHQKKAVYARHGLPEFIVHVVHSNELHWFLCREGEYVPNEPDERGILRSRILPGLWLDPGAFLRGDMAAVLEKLSEGLASSEHEAFAGELRSRLAR